MVEGESPLSFLSLSSAERIFERRFQRLPPEVRLLIIILGDPLVTGTTYAWSNLVHYIAYKYHEVAVEDTSGTFIALDLGSAFPMWSTMLRNKNSGFLSPTRKYLAISLDIEDPSRLVAKARNSFPPEFRRTPFYFITEFMEDHVQGNILALPFTPNSISFLTNFEAYPFYFGDKSYEEHLRFAKQVMEILKPGGKAIFFPWILSHEHERNGKVLADVKNYWITGGMDVSVRRFAWRELVDHMGLREEILMNVSPIFNKSFKKTIPALILTNPK